MKKLVFAFVAAVAVSAWVHAEITPEECFKRCMEKVDDKAKCKEICYPKNNQN